MLENIIMTFFTGAMVLIVFGSIAMWVISYVVDELRAVRGTSPIEWIVAIAMCLAIGSAVS